MLGAEEEAFQVAAHVQVGAAEVDAVAARADGVGDGAAGIERLMDDRKLALDLSARASEVVERFALSKVLEQWDAVFAEVAARPVGPSGRA